MDFSFTPEQDKLRQEVRDFFINELPSDFRPGITTRRAANSRQFDFWMALQQKAGARGYLTPGWSKESGGLGLSGNAGGAQDEEYTAGEG